MAINLTTAELNNTIDEAVDLGPREETTSFADWMMGAVSLTCFLMAVACFTLKHAVNDKQEAKTWIQRRLSKDVPVKCPMPSAKGNVIPAPTCKDEDADKEDVSCSSFSSKSSETECKRKRSSKKKKKGKTSKSNDESTCGSKSSVECKSEKDEKNYHTKLDKLREMGEIEDDEKCETDDDADDGVAQFAILAQMDKIRNKEKMRRRSRLRKIKLTKAAVKRPLPVLNRNSSCSREESQTKRSPPKKTTRKQRNTSSAGGNGRVRSKCESSVATRASEATNSIARETIHNTARETINSTARETSLLPDVNEASGSSEQKPAARSRSRTKRQKNVTSYSGKSVRFGKNEEQPSKD